MYNFHFFGPKERSTKVCFAVKQKFFETYYILLLMQFEFRGKRYCNALAKFLKRKTTMSNVFLYIFKKEIKKNPSRKIGVLWIIGRLFMLLL